MSSITALLIASALFVGTHFLMSHPLRAPLVGAIGERGFMVLYSLVSAGLLVWMVLAYRAAPATPLFWPVGNAIWAGVTVVMLLASVLLMGSLIGNPALPDPGGSPKAPEAARDVFAITRHPMMWSIGLWAACHVAVYPMLANIIVAVAIGFLALVGAAAQDVKKERLQPEMWRGWEAKTSYWPFVAVAAGRARLEGLRPHTWAGGLVIWLAATWGHIPLAGFPAGIWKWV